VPLKVYVHTVQFVELFRVHVTGPLNEPLKRVPSVTLPYVPVILNVPPAAKRVARIGDAVAIDIERLLRIHPDVVVAWPAGGNPKPEPVSLPI
jgi:ABC-type Fe3+-hydroxamate transport system substrate-binding protein